MPAVTPKAGIEPTEALRKELIAHVRGKSVRSPAGRFQWAPGLPEDPLRQDHAPHSAQDRRQRSRCAGDTSTLADPNVVTDLVDNRAVK